MPSPTLLLCLIALFTSGCANYNRTHAIHEIRHAFDEPMTMSINAFPDPSHVDWEMLWEIPWYNVDGHGLYDVRAVAAEAVVAAPTLILMGGVVYPFATLEEAISGNDQTPVTMACVYTPIRFLVETPSEILDVGVDWVMHDIPLVLWYTPALLIPKR